MQYLIQGAGSLVMLEDALESGIENRVLFQGVFGQKVETAGLDCQ